MKRCTTLALSLAAVVALVGCGGSAPASSTPATDEAPAEETTSTTSEETTVTWLDAVDWSKYQVQDNPFELGESKLTAPFTFDSLFAAATEVELSSVDDTGAHVDVDASQLAQSTAKPSDTTNTEPRLGKSSLVIDGDTYALGYYDLANAKTYQELYAANQFELSSENVYRSYWLVDVEDPEDGRGEAYLFEALLDKYGRPSWVITMDNWSIPEIYWERDGYKFGLYIEDLSGVWNEINYSPKCFYYVTDAAWDGLVESKLSDTKYKQFVMTFDEFLAANGK